MVARFEANGSHGAACARAIFQLPDKKLRPLARNPSRSDPEVAGFTPNTNEKHERTEVKLVFAVFPPPKAAA